MTKNYSFKKRSKSLQNDPISIFRGGRASSTCKQWCKIAHCIVKLVLLWIYPWPLARWSATVPASILCRWCLVNVQRSTIPSINDQWCRRWTGPSLVNDRYYLSKTVGRSVKQALGVLLGAWREALEGCGEPLEGSGAAPGRLLGGSWEALGRLLEASKRHLRPKTVIARKSKRFLKKMKIWGAILATF